MTDDLNEDVTTPADDTDEQVEVIATDIEQTREEMTGTVQAIGQRLDPANIVQDAKETVREATVGRVEQMTSSAMETASDTGSGILETIRRNPLPAAIAAIGIGWLLMNRSDGRSSYRPDRYGDAGWRAADRYRSGSYGGPAVTERAGETLEQVGRQAGRVAEDVRSTVGSTVGQLPDQVGSTARDVGWNAQRLAEENPLALGAVAFAVGAAVGMALPETDVERNVLGGAADNAIDKVQRAASDAVQQLEPANA
jgi:Protein of unknown function (DUF3618)